MLVVAVELNPGGGGDYKQELTWSPGPTSPEWTKFPFSYFHHGDFPIAPLHR